VTEIPGGRAELIRAVADRAFLPTKNVLEEVGNMMILTGKTLVAAVRRRIRTVPSSSGSSYSR